VSAGIMARSTLAAVGGDRVKALQHALYRAAKADPNRRFHALQDKVYREHVLWREPSLPPGHFRPWKVTAERRR